MRLTQRSKRALSPYRRYDKRPFRYSAEIGECIAACKAGKADAYDDASRRFLAKHPDMRERARRAPRYTAPDHEVVIDDHGDVMPLAA